METKQETLRVRIDSRLKSAIWREANKMMVKPSQFVRLVLAERCAGMQTQQQQEPEVEA